MPHHLLLLLPSVPPLLLLPSGPPVPPLLLLPSVPPVPPLPPLRLTGFDFMSIRLSRTRVMGRF